MCISAHKKLLDKAKILHRDISVNNVMINTLAKAQIQAAQPSTLKHSYPTQLKNQSARIPLPIRKGLLVDFDYATFYEAGTNRKVYKGHRTVRENSSNPLNSFTYFAFTRELFLSWLERSFVMVLKPRIGRRTTSSPCSTFFCGFVPIIVGPTMRSERMQNAKICLS